ncbi:MAG: NADP-dependent oxidoreductase [Solirubrobacteraceae bacterium]
MNRQLRLASRPTGLPARSNWELTEQPIPTPGVGELLIEVTHISVDPAMRGWMRDRPSYIAPVALGEVMRAPGVGRVVTSHDQSLPEGSWVTGLLGVQEYAISDGSDLLRVDPDLAPVSCYIGALGIPGLTAYFGMRDIGRIKPGDTVVVSGAAGAVGSIAVQIAKIEGCRVVAVAGGGDKCAWLTEELGVDVAIDYKNDDLGARLREATPDRVDVFFDNVGGEVLDRALARLAVHGRIVLCGAISQYNATSPWGPVNYLSLITNRASMTGLIVFDYKDRYPEAIDKLAAWIGEGRLVVREQIVKGGIEQFPDTLLSLFAGENTGKLLLELG